MIGVMLVIGILAVYIIGSIIIVYKKEEEEK